MKKLAKNITLSLTLCALVGLAVWVLPLSWRPAPTASGEDVRSRLCHCIRTTDWVGLEDAAADCMKLPGNQSEAARLRGYAALAQGKVVDAEVHFLRAASLETLQSGRSEPLIPADTMGDCPIGLLLDADRAARGGDIHRAWVLVTRALDLAPSLSVSRLFRASLETRANRLDAALGDLALIGQHDPVLNEARLVQALTHLSQGRNDIAQNELRSLVESNPDQPLALNTMGVLRALEGKWPEAVDAFAKAYRVSPQFADAKRNWRLASKAANAPGSIIALRTEVQDASRRAMEAIGQSYNNSLAAAQDTAFGDSLRDWSPVASGAGTVGALTDNPALALGGSFAGDVLNRVGERLSQSAAIHAEAASQADQSWDREIEAIMRSGAQAYPGSPQAQAYQERISRVHVLSDPSSSSSLTRDSGMDACGGVSAELTEPTRTSNGRVVFHPSGAAPEELVVAYPIFVNR